MAQLIVTAVGPDRPGIVADLSRLVYDAGASLADSRMVNLRGQFALLAAVEGAPEAIAKLKARLADAGAALRLALEAREPGGSPAAAQGIPYKLKTYSADQPGIVARVTEVMRKHNVNVEELSTRLESAPFAGTPLFTMEGTVLVPSSASVRRLREELQALGDEIACDVDLDPA